VSQCKKIIITRIMQTHICVDRNEQKNDEKIKISTCENKCANHTHTQISRLRKNITLLITYRMEAIYG